MSVTPDAITLKRLVLVKQLYQHALVQSTTLRSYTRKIMAVVGFDLAIETALKAVVYALEQSKAPQDRFVDLVTQSNDLLVAANFSPLPDRANILHVHRTRNDAQHKASYPND